ncbi:MAG: helix-turn-helix transcriptional regulator, partial [Phaeodactylibacter sp.]|nr:helix-turn-helix transcriptional regulator [Phaeodactylibacter sp.]
FDKPEIIGQLQEAYRRESNSLVRLRIAWLLTQGRYERFDEFPELSPEHRFDEESLRLFLVPSIKEAYETIIKVDRESEYVLEESIRVLALLVIHYFPEDLHTTEELIRRHGIGHSSDRVRHISNWAMNRIEETLQQSRMQAGPAPPEAETGLASSDTENRSQESQEWVELLRDTVEASIDDVNFSVGQLADMMASSERNLHRKVREMLGMTPNQYIQEMRLLSAKRLLENRTYGTVKQVCLAIGFKKPDYFTRIFEKKFGRRPSSYL